MTESKHYLSLPRAIVFQLAGVVGIAAGALSSYGLKSYTNQQTLATSYGATINNAPIAAASAIVVTSGALAGTAVGLMTFALMLRPGHSESQKSVRIKEIVFGVLTLFSLVAALVATIITATGSAKLNTDGLSQTSAVAVKMAIGSLKYKSSKVNVAIAVLSFISFTLMVISTFLISRSARYVQKNGPAVGVKQSFQERIAAPYLDKMFGPASDGSKLKSTGSSVHEI